MTDETQKLFSAPWKAEEYKHGKGAFVVRNNGGYLVAENMSELDANSLARLPELYDALLDVLYEDCHVCLESYIDRCEIPTLAFMLENGCPKNEKSCFYQKYWKLLKKVRDGK